MIQTVSLEVAKKLPKSFKSEYCINEKGIVMPSGVYQETTYPSPAAGELLRELAHSNADFPVLRGKFYYEKAWAAECELPDRDLCEEADTPEDALAKLWIAIAS